MTPLDLETLLYRALVTMPCTCRSAHYNGPIVEKCRRCVACAAYELKAAQRAIVQTPSVALAQTTQGREPDEVGERADG